MVNKLGHLPTELALVISRFERHHKGYSCTRAVGVLCFCYHLSYIWSPDTLVFLAMCPNYSSCFFLRFGISCLLVPANSRAFVLVFFQSKWCLLFCEQTIFCRLKVLLHVKIVQHSLLYGKMDHSQYLSTLSLDWGQYFSILKEIGYLIQGVLREHNLHLHFFMSIVMLC